MLLLIEGTRNTPFSNTKLKNRTTREILSFTKLPVGWHYGEGEHISNSVCLMALELNSYALDLGLLRTEAFPGVDGEVMVSIYRHGHVLDFTIYPEGFVRYRHDFNNDEIEAEDDLTFEAAKQRLFTFWMTTWNLSDSLTPSTSVQKKDNTKISPSQIVASMEEYQLLTKGVQWKPAPIYANT